MEQLKKIGQLKPLHARDITHSKMGIGFEKLDRNVFDPTKAYDKIAALGIKWIRIQSGWARTEKEKGVYDFEWLDSIVDALIARGMVPWMCLCYGNGLYTPDGNRFFGAVGCVPNHSEEALNAWLNYVKTLTARYRGKVVAYEVWNEPDGKWCWKNGPNGAEYGAFAAATARAVRQGDESAEVYGGSVCMRDLLFTQEALAAGMAKEIDALTFHEYTADETTLPERVSTLRALCHGFNPRIEIIQGESGSQSSSLGAGALRGGAWTQEKQAKQLLRHAVKDVQCGAKFTSYFTSVDMIEALNGFTGDKASYLDYGYFGVLGADFDEEGFSSGDYTPKKAYYALQNLCALMAETPEITTLPILLNNAPSKRLLGETYRDLRFSSAAFIRPNGSAAFAYWHASDLMTTAFEASLSLQIAWDVSAMRLVDPMDGAVYTIADELIERQGTGCVLVNELPVKDYPLFLTFGDFVSFK